MSLTFKLKRLSSFAQFNTCVKLVYPFKHSLLVYILCFDRSNMIAFCKRNA